MLLEFSLNIYISAAIRNYIYFSIKGKYVVLFTETLNMRRKDNAILYFKHSNINITKVY